jgi:hypothetical protein
MRLALAPIIVAVEENIVVTEGNVDLVVAADEEDMAEEEKVAVEEDMVVADEVVTDEDESRSKSLINFIQQI